MLTNTSRAFESKPHSTDVCSIASTALQILTDTSQSPPAILLGCPNMYLSLRQINASNWLLLGILLFSLFSLSKVLGLTLPITEHFKSYILTVLHEVRISSQSMGQDFFLRTLIMCFQLMLSNFTF